MAPNSLPIFQVPYIGGMVKALIGAFWPDDNKDAEVFEGIKDQVEGLIDQKIFEYEFKVLKKRLAL